MRTKTHISAAIVKARKRLGYTQRQLANHLGVSRSGLSRYENGNRMPPQSIVNQLKRMLGGSENSTLTRVLQNLRE